MLKLFQRKLNLKVGQMKTEKVFKFICVGGYREEREALLSLIQLQKKYTNFSEKKKSFLKNQYIFGVIKSFDLVGIFIDKFCLKKNNSSSVLFILFIVDSFIQAPDSIPHLQVTVYCRQSTKLKFFIH